jgi:hypothetical protein
VYRAFHQSEEPAQITESPLTTLTFEDHVDLNTLNENIFYSVMAIDRSQNHSDLSEALKVKLPDKVKPLPPVILPVTVTRNGIRLSWTPGGSEDIARYLIYRKGQGDDGWLLVNTIDASRDSAYTFVDDKAPYGTRNIYTVVSVDDAGLQSEPSHPVSAVRPSRLRQPIKWKKLQVNPEENLITVSWEYQEPGVAAFKIIRATNDLPPILLSTVPGDKFEYMDKLIPGNTYGYRIIVEFENGEKSLVSEEQRYQH